MIRDPRRPRVRKLDGRWLIVYSPEPAVAVVLAERDTLVEAHQWATWWARWIGSQLRLPDALNLKGETR